MTATLRIRIRLGLAAHERGEGGRPRRRQPAAPPGPPPVGAPIGFRERLARALKTTDPEVLRAAEADFRGVYESEHAYIAAQVADHLQPPDMAWLLACCDPAKLREGYQGRALVVWSIPLDDRACMVFESVRESTELLRAALAIEPDDDAPESPCPICGARDWMIFVHAEDAELTPLGCDRCLARSCAP